VVKKNAILLIGSNDVSDRFIGFMDVLQIAALTHPREMSQFVRVHFDMLPYKLTSLRAMKNYVAVFTCEFTIVRCYRISAHGRLMTALSLQIILQKFIMKINCCMLCVDGY